MIKNIAIAGVVIATAVVLTGCTSSDTRLSDDTTPVASEPKDGALIQDDFRTGKPLPKKFITFMNFLNDTNVYVVEAELTDKAEIIAAYKRV